MLRLGDSLPVSPPNTALDLAEANMHVRGKLAVLLVIASLLAPASAQETTPSSGGASPLGVRQQRVERMMEDLERKFRQPRSSACSRPNRSGPSG